MSSSAKIVVSDGVRESTPGEDGRGIIGPYNWRELFNIDLTATDEAGNRAKRKVYHFLAGSERSAILNHHLPDDILVIMNIFPKSEDNLSGDVIIDNLIHQGRIFKEGIPDRGPPVVEKVKEFQCIQCLSGRKT